MNTRVVKPDARALEEAGALIRAGQVVGFPTETVYGLGGNALDGEAVKRIFAAKGRPGDNPLIVHISALDQLSKVISGEMPESARDALPRTAGESFTLPLRISRRAERILVFISAAAALVNVTISICEISALPLTISSTIRPVREAVFPLPAAAERRRSPSP